MSDAVARGLVTALRAAGLRDTDIGRALGRDSGAIAQIGADKRGAGYGAGYRDSLRDLLAQTSGQNAAAARTTAAELGRRGELAPARRTTREGAPAPVRRGEHRAAPRPAGGLAPVHTTGTGAGRATFDRRLEQGVSEHRNVYLKVTVSDPSKRSGKREIGLGEMSAAELRERLEATGRKGLKAQLQALLDAMSDGGEIGSDSAPVTGYSLSLIGT